MESEVSAAGSGTREEREVVSVLFADLVDFVARFEQSIGKVTLIRKGRYAKSDRLAGVS
jgi:hypothetical protein